MMDPAELAVRLNRALAAHGVIAGTARTTAFARALGVAALNEPDDLYWIARISLLPRIDDLAAFDAAFYSVAAAQFTAPSSEARSAPAREAQTETGALGSIEERERVQHAPDMPVEGILAALASPFERIAERDFADFAGSERAELFQLIDRIRSARETRPSRRRVAANRGDRLDFRSTLRIAARTAGELVRRKRSQRRERLRPLVFLCDVSGSMRPYADALLRYARASALARPRVRAFAFATRLTEIGPALARPGRAAAAALRRSLLDFGGGTRIGAALRELNDRYAQRGIARGGTVVVLSDGWERDGPGLLAEEMARLRRLARRIIWVNPQKKSPGYEPLVAGMQAALPYVDAFVPGHNLRSLFAVADAIDAVGRGVTTHR